ncbi:MAG TPA: HypC/HybG/HupF family hydrogenase formation chaperone [Syntrophales bacterium]|nr:HypC/HybG/HupF family hydrogenase formation chaperone [Syntrophobacterales bacterium]HRR42717.1 HypC/HybG/HupF family hydrogenase formation chaperone [Syntrophales bacterium]
MCIAFPGKIISIDDDRVAVIDISGTRREVYLDLIDEDVTVGDYVISHAGYALHKVDEETARESLSYLKTIIESEA